MAGILGVGLNTQAQQHRTHGHSRHWPPHARRDVQKEKTDNSGQIDRFNRSKMPPVVKPSKPSRLPESPAADRSAAAASGATALGAHMAQPDVAPTAGPPLHISLRQLAVFVATARAGSTRGAAERISRSQSAASAALAELEQALGVELFDRVRRRLVLNENGRALLPRAAALLDQAAEIQQLFHGEHAMPLRVAASLTIGEVLMPDLLARWKARHPASPVRIDIGNTREVVQAVAAFEADLGFIEGPQTHPELRVEPWLTDEMLVVASPDHPLARRRKVTPDALRDAVWAMREAGSGSREVVDHWLLEHLGRIELAYEVGSTEAIKRLALNGTALACLSRLTVADALTAGTLVTLRTGLPPARRRLSIVRHQDKHLGRGAADFLAHCQALSGGSG
jgi:DNA-binding transcriptional LysR family regulator